MRLPHLHPSPPAAHHMETEGYRCLNHSTLESGQSALPSSLLFSTGLLGNLLALCLLARQLLRRPGQGRGHTSAFTLLVAGLAVTDLLGKCLLSPVVLVAYAHNRSLSHLWPAAPGEQSPGLLCRLFASLMAFFGLAPMLLLLAMALECWLSLAHPYFYRCHVRRHRPAAALALALAAGLCAVFCALPLLGLFGVPIQYCPGTWCFVRMAGPAAGYYAALYAGLLGALGLAVGLCNAASMRSLLRMARRPPCRAPFPAATAPRMEERDHLVLLGLMTCLFAICCLPLLIRAYVGVFAPDFDEEKDLTALRFLSVNSIVDPWVFIIFRTSVFRMFLHRVCRRLNSKRATNASASLNQAPKPQERTVFCFLR